MSPAAPVAVLRAQPPAVTGHGDPAAAIRAAVARGPNPAAFAACRHNLIAHRGQAAARTKAVLYDLLGRPVPGFLSRPPA